MAFAQPHLRYLLKMRVGHFFFDSKGLDYIWGNHPLNQSLAQIETQIYNDMQKG